VHPCIPGAASHALPPSPVGRQVSSRHCPLGCVTRHTPVPRGFRDAHQAASYSSHACVPDSSHTASGQKTSRSAVRPPRLRDPATPAYCDVCRSRGGIVSPRTPGAKRTPDVSEQRSHSVPFVPAHVIDTAGHGLGGGPGGRDGTAQNAFAITHPSKLARTWPEHHGAASR